MASFFLAIFLFQDAYSVDEYKFEFCSTLNCVSNKESVCGLRQDSEGFRIRLFDSECDLLKYGCSVNDELAYGIVNKEYCIESLTDVEKKKDINQILFNRSSVNTNCQTINCNENITKPVCGIRQVNVGYNISLFENMCELIKYNCENDLNFEETDLFICKASDSEVNDNGIDKINNVDDNKVTHIKNLVVVNTNMFDRSANINESVDSFFAASHIVGLPIKEVSIDTRRKWVQNAGPVKVFVPWIVIPKNISNDTYHAPTLSSCYHKCPTVCPDTYAPVCGVPGIVAREPSLIFQNHCFMDVAQCKMFWEQKSSTAHSSSYVETSFLFCMGDEMNAVYRFLPAIRTLQRMGRLKKKGKFRFKLNNFRFIADFRGGYPKFMG